MIYSLASKTHLLTLIAFHLALYLPMIGHGLVFDDFRHLYSAAFQSLQYGLTRVQGGPFFDPLVWLTFKADWMLWGGRSFPMAAENLLLHVANIVMLYFLTLRLWQSQIAAWWAALGFALLFPANTWAVMYIATRGHVIGAFFYALEMTLPRHPGRSAIKMAYGASGGFEVGWASSGGVHTIRYPSLVVP